MYQKTIKLFLQDGDPNERIICELSNWDGIAYKIPKAMLKESKGLKYINNTGVYLLFGEKEEIPYAYVGESENLYDRLIQHLNDDKDFWIECVAFTRKDNSLNKAHIKYIENILYKEAKKAARYEVDNGLTPTQSSLSEYEEAEMKEIIDNIKMLTNALGYKVFSYTEKKKVENKNILYFKTKNFEAKGIITNEGFMVLKGSKVSKILANKSLGKGYKALRMRLEKEKIINENYEFTTDYIFNSSSAAAKIVSGYSCSGPIVWKNKEGKMLKEWS